MTKFYPLGERILVKRVDREEKTAGGLIIPQKAQERPLEGIVIAADRELTVSPGTRVLFKKYAETAIKLDGEEYLVLNIEDVLGTLEEEE